MIQDGQKERLPSSQGEVEGPWPLRRAGEHLLSTTGCVMNQGRLHRRSEGTECFERQEAGSLPDWEREVILGIWGRRK